MRCTRVLNLTGEYDILRIAPTAIAVAVTPTAAVSSGWPRRGSRNSVARIPPTSATSSGIGYGPPGSFQRPSNLAMTMRTRLARVYHLATNMRGAAYLVPLLVSPPMVSLETTPSAGREPTSPMRTTPTARVFNAAVLFLPMK